MTRPYTLGIVNSRVFDEGEAQPNKEVISLLLDSRAGHDTQILPHCGLS